MIARTGTGLLFHDTFNRADGAPGTDYTVAAGRAAIVSNKLRITGAGVGEGHLVNGAGQPLEALLYGLWTPSASGAEIGMGTSDGGNYWFAQLFGGNARLFRGSGFTLLSSTSFPLVGGQTYAVSFYAKSGEQKLWIDGSLVVQATDATAGLTGKPYLRSTINTTHADLDEYAVASGLAITVSGLPSGFSARAKNAGGTVVAGPVTGVAGVALLPFGGVAFPAGSVEVLDGSGAVSGAAFSAADVSPPDTFLFTLDPEPEAPTVTVSSIGKRAATLTGSAYFEDGPGTHAASQFRVRDTADDSIVSGPTTTGALTALPMTGLPFFTGGLVGEIRYQDSAGTWGDWGTSAAFITLGWDEGAERLLIYESDDETVWAECGSTLDHVRPYLLKPEGYGSAEIDLAKGSASIGQQNVSILDKRTDSADQGSGWFSAKLPSADGESALIGRRAVRQRWTGGEWVTVLDGVISDVDLMDSNVGFRLVLKDIRERERKTRAFHRTGTSMVFPRGVASGYGALPGGAWLVPPAAPVTGTMKRSTATIGQVLIDGADVNDPDPRLVMTAAMAEVIRPVFDDALQVLVADLVTVLWRAEGSTGAYTELSRMQMPERELWQYKLKPNVLDGDKVRPTLKALVAKLQNAEIVTAVRMCGAAIPTHNQRVEVLVRYDGPATERYPFHYDGTFGELLRNLYRGDYSTDISGNPVAPGIRYDEAAVLALDVPCRMRATEPTDDLREWAQKNVYQPLGAAPAIIDGVITPIRYALPDADAVLPVLTRDNCLRAPRWSHTGGDMVNLVRLQYARDYYRGSDEDPMGEETDGDGISSRQVTIEVTHPASYALNGEKKLEIKPATLRSLGGANGALLTGDVMDETPAQLARDRGSQALDRFVYGGQHVEATVLESAASGMIPGAWVLVQLPNLPDYRTARRALAANGVDVTERLAQIVAVERPNRGLRELRLVDAGAVNQPALAPTLGTLSADADGVVSVPVTVVPAGTTAAVEYAVAATAPATGSGQWIPLGRSDAPLTLTTPALPAGSVVWVRARGVVAGERSSLYTVPVSITVPATPRLRDVRIRFADDGTATVYHTPNAYALAVRVEYSIQDAGEVELTAGSVDASTAAGLVVIPDLVPADYVLVADVTGYSGWSGSAATGTAGETQRVKARRVIGPWIYDVVMAFVSPNRLSATVSLNGYVQLWSVWSANGADPTVGGVPDPYMQRAKDMQPDQTEVSWPVKDGTHHMLFRASGKDGEYHELSTTFEVTGIGGEGETGVTAPTDIPSTPRVFAGDVVGLDRDVYLEWVNTNDIPAIETQFVVDGVADSIRSKPAASTSDATSFPASSRVRAHVRYTNGSGLEGPWSSWSAEVRLTDLAPLPPP